MAQFFLIRTDLARFTQLLSFNGLAHHLPTICKKSSQRTSNSDSRQKKDVLKNIHFSNYFMLAVFSSLIKFSKIVLICGVKFCAKFEVLLQTQFLSVLACFQNQLNWTYLL